MQGEFGTDEELNFQQGGNSEGSCGNALIGYHSGENENYYFECFPHRIMKTRTVQGRPGIEANRRL